LPIGALRQYVAKTYKNLYNLNGIDKTSSVFGYFTRRFTKISRPSETRGEETGAFRVLYVAKFPLTIYVLHCFQKKTPKTDPKDIDLAAKRYRELVKEINQ
jgi:hypothetical protein